MNGELLGNGGEAPLGQRPPLPSLDPEVPYVPHATTAATHQRVSEPLRAVVEHSAQFRGLSRRNRSKLELRGIGPAPPRAPPGPRLQADEANIRWRH